jgi:ATP-dependent Lhr-like helicase
VTPISFVPREHLEEWLTFTDTPSSERMSGPASDLLAALRTGGPMFPQNLQKAAKLVSGHVEMGLADLLARGAITCDSFGALRQMITPPSRRRAALRPVGRWSIFRPDTVGEHGEEQNEMAARQLLQRTGVVFRKTITREKLPVSWGTLIRICRRMELRGEVRGGRFVAGFSGEQFALPQAVELLRKLRREGERDPVSVEAADPLNFQGILTPEKRVGAQTREAVLVG